MARNLNSLMDLARHAAGQRIDARLDTRELVNEAGEYVAIMHGWAFYERPAVLIDFVGGQKYVDLPADLGSIDGVEVASAVQIAVDRVSIERLNELRADELTTAEHYFAALEWPDQASASESPPPPRLALWPTPPANTAQALRVAWRAKWRTLVEGMDRHNLPGDCETLLIEVLRAIVHGRTRENTNVSDELDRIEQSMHVRRLKERYTRAQPGGQVRGGVLESTRSRRVQRRFSVIRMASDA